MAAKPKFQVKNYYFTEKRFENYKESAQEQSLRSIITKSNILKFEDKILISNMIFICKSINNILPPVFKNWFIFCSEIHNNDTVSLSTNTLFKSFYGTDYYGKNSITATAINCQNETQNMLGGQPLKYLQPTKIKNILTQRHIDKYQLFVKILVENYIGINKS